jgi:hypothetical protein
MRRVIVATALVAVTAGSAEAQIASCPGGTAVEQGTQDACQKAVDLFAYMAPQLGAALVGGSHTPGQGGTLGGLPHFAISLRANGVFGSVPDVSNMTVSGTGRQQDEFATENQVIPMPGVDAAVGLFKGIPLGLTNVAGVDLLLSATYVPNVDAADVSVEAPDGSLKIGYGARVGLLQESLVIPGVSFSIMQRGLPKLNLGAATAGGTGSLDITELEVSTTSWRLNVSKNLVAMTLGVGVGQDRYNFKSGVSGTVGPTSSSTVQIDQSLTRTNVYGSFALNMFVAKLVGEAGIVRGGEVETFNTFADKAADDARPYGSVAFRIGF